MTMKISERSKPSGEKTTFEGLFGFKLDDLSTWPRFVQLMNRPCHPANLAVFRVLYGLMMLIDAVDERGLVNADSRWGDKELCRFPLIHSLQPLSFPGMVLLYLIMACGALGIVLGFMFRASCLMFALPYWFIIILDKMRWNNHSYLFGLISIFLLLSDANRYWSIDGLIWKYKRNAHIPLWNYFIPRFQLFILYFIAGLKKFDSDWTRGYSMSLAHHFVFAPARLFFSNETIDMFVVHTCGHMIDLFLIYLLFFDKTRPFGIVIGYMFNIMNATMFSIGMFPYMCLATIPLYCSFDWPVRWFRKVHRRLKFLAPLDAEPQPSYHCIYDKEAIETEKENVQNGFSSEQPKSSMKHMKNKAGFYHKFFAVFAMCYAAEQLFLPYSHFITQGYNGWTNGLYGYSWDMMIHSWSVQFVKITYVEKDTGDIGYIKSDAFVVRQNRWSSNADMIKQYAHCIEQRLAERNKTNVEIYIDVWKSMNQRFQQRVLDPRVDILKADWHPFKKTAWMLPLLVDLSDWRGELSRMRNDTIKSDNFTNIVFVADFPGLYLSNFIQLEIGEANLTVLHGSVQVELIDRNETKKLVKGESMSLPLAEFHNVRTISETPSCYYYRYKDRDQKEKVENYTAFIADLKVKQGVDSDLLLNATNLPDDDNTTTMYKGWLRQKQEKKKAKSHFSFITHFFKRKYSWMKSVWHNVNLAIRVYKTGRDPIDVQRDLFQKTPSTVPDDDENKPISVDDEKKFEADILYKERIMDDPRHGTVKRSTLDPPSDPQNRSDVDKSTQDHDKSD